MERLLLLLLTTQVLLDRILQILHFIQKLPKLHWRRCGSIEEDKVFPFHVSCGLRDSHGNNGVTYHRHGIFLCFFFSKFWWLCVNRQMLNYISKAQSMVCGKPLEISLFYLILKETCNNLSIQLFSLNYEPATVVGCVYLGNLRVHSFHGV